MKPRRQVSRAALELIKRFEGYRRQAARLADGRWTIGYGHTQTARQGAEVSEADAEALLIYDLMKVTMAVEDSVFAPLSQNQFDALVAFAFNVGLDEFRGSELLRRINEGEPLRAASAFDLWRKAEFEGERIVVDALVRRRAAEKALFLTAEGQALAPTPLLKPELDDDLPDLAPREVVEILPSLEGDHVTARRAEPGETPADVPASGFRPARGDGWTELKEEAPGEHQVAEPFLAEPVADTAPPVEAFAPIQASSEEAVIEETTAKPSAMLWSWGLALAGAILFAVGLVWVYNGRAGAGAPIGVGLAVGVVGLLCLSVAGYFLLDHLGARQDAD
jgi:lysozyme